MLTIRAFPAVAGHTKWILRGGGETNEIKAEIAYVAARNLDKSAGLEIARVRKERESPATNA